jgi:hypothetical protein
MRQYAILRLETTDFVNSGQDVASISRTCYKTLIKIAGTGIHIPDLTLTRFNDTPLSLLLPFSHDAQVLLSFFSAFPVLF